MNIASSHNYNSRRSPVLSSAGMVASSQPLASMAGIDILGKGGNAADAAVAVAAALNVTQPCSTGLGGDVFCLYYEASSGKIIGLNGSGRSPAALSLERITREGFSGFLPDIHPYTVTVPGAPAAWADVLDRLGRLSLSEVLAPAIGLAENGFPVAPLASRWWANGAKLQLSKQRFGKELMVGDRGPLPGEIIRLPTLANSLKTLARDGKQPFYEGAIAEKIVAAVSDAGGALALSDLAGHASEWVDPIGISYRGIKIWECPPNGQGLAALLALNIAGQFDMRDIAADSAERYHLLIECMRLAFADTAYYVADPDFSAAPLAELLSDGYANSRSKLIDPASVNENPFQGRPADRLSAGSDTVYFCVVDGEGNGCSFINSNYMGFGTGIVPQGCGYSIQNRGRGFRLEKGHPNCFEPGKRPYHTIIPGLATDATDNSLFAVFGVMGGMMQAQGHLQVVSAAVDDDLDPQAALDRARFQLVGGRADGGVRLEDGVNPTVPEGLRQKGQEIEIVSGVGHSSFGVGQIIQRTADGVLWAGSDPRSDGCALGQLW